MPLHLGTVLIHLNQICPTRMKMCFSLTTVAVQDATLTGEIPTATVRFHWRRSITITKTTMMTTCPYIAVTAHSKRTFKYTAVVEVEFLMNPGLYLTRDIAVPLGKI
jgi:hypothetical protein